MTNLGGGVVGLKRNEGLFACFGLVVFSLLAGGCAFTPIAVSGSGLAIGVYQHQYQRPDHDVSYDRLAGFGVAVWDGSLIVGYMDHAKLVVGPEAEAVAFVAPELEFGSSSPIQVLTGEIAELNADPYRLLDQLPLDTGLVYPSAAD